MKPRLIVSNGDAVLPTIPRWLRGTVLAGVLLGLGYVMTSPWLGIWSGIAFCAFLAVLLLKRHNLLPLAMLLPLLGAPSPARADLSLGELAQGVSDGVEDWFSELYDLICSYMLQPIEGLPEIVPQPLPAPDLAHLDGAPTTIEQSQEYATQRLDDRQRKVEQLDATVTAVNAAAARSQAAVAALTAANAVPPVSLVANGQIQAAGILEGVQAQTTTAQGVAALLALQADQAMAQEQARAVNQAQVKSLYGDVQGGRLQATPFKSWW